MNPEVLASFLGVIEQLAPLLGGGSLPQSLTVTVIEALIKALPVAIQDARDLIPIIKNIIAALKVGSVTQQQWNDLHAMEKQIDADFDAAAAAALAEDRET